MIKLSDLMKAYLKGIGKTIEISFTSDNFNEGELLLHTKSIKNRVITE